MFETMKEVLALRIKAADENPFFCPTCNAPRYSADVSCLEDTHTLVCKHCSASLCAVVEGRDDRTFSLHEANAPSNDTRFFAANRSVH